jgi:hypothetical protein
MEQKWVLAWRKEEGLLLAARSWTGMVEAVGVGRHEGDILRIDKLHITKASVLRLGVLPQSFEWLVRSHALQERLPFPLTDEGAAAIEQSHLAAFSAFGSMIFCASKTWAPPPILGRLYSDGVVIRAAQRGDLAALRNAVDGGEDVNAPGTLGGMCALHIAVATGNQALLDLLISLKADPCILNSRGDTALIVGVAHRTPLAVLSAIQRITPTQLRVANSKGFSALHAAAEAGYAEAIPWLLGLGADIEGRTVPGHTPLHIACALGQVEAAKALLAAGADPLASSPNGTPREVALSEGMDQTAALFDS